MSFYEILLGVTVLGWVLFAIAMRRAMRRAKYDTDLWPNGCKICGAPKGCWC